jgi:hypothetical protein
MTDLPALREALTLAEWVADKKTAAIAEGAEWRGGTYEGEMRTLAAAVRSYQAHEAGYEQEVIMLRRELGERNAALAEVRGRVAELAHYETKYADILRRCREDKEHPCWCGCHISQTMNEPSKEAL